MLYWEDLAVGTDKLFGHYDVTREEVLEFATKYDPQPFHLSDEAAATGLPAQRALFLHYPQDRALWTVQDAFLYGGDLLVAPVIEEGAMQREVVLPGDTPDTLAARVLVQEHRLYPAALGHVLNGTPGWSDPAAALLNPLPPPPAGL